jgi:PAS domain S-box-containing protein
MEQAPAIPELPVDAFFPSAEFLQLAEMLPHIVWIALPDGYNIYQNSRFYDFSGLTPAEARGGGWARVLHPEDVARTSQAWENACRTGEPYEIEYRFRGKDGRYRWFLTRAACHRNAQGDIDYWYGTNTDVHEKKLLEESLQRVNTDLDNFVHMASHDLKGPIGNLEGLLGVLLKRMAPSLDDDTREIAGLLKGSLGKLRQTVKDLATVSQASQTFTEAEPVAFAEVLAEVQQDLQPQLDDAQAALRVDWQVATTPFPRKHLRSILYNLVCNAVKYRSADRQLSIAVATAPGDGMVNLTVADNGSGLSAAQHSRLFTLGQRFHAGVEGSGVGLYLIKRIVENYKGYIEVESREGEGTTFRIGLPSAT